MPFITRQSMRDTDHNKATVEKCSVQYNKAANKEMPFIIRQPLRNAVHNKAANKEKPLKTRQGWEFAHLISKQIACFFLFFFVKK